MVVVHNFISEMDGMERRENLRHGRSPPLLTTNRLLFNLCSGSRTRKRSRRAGPDDREFKLERGEKDATPVPAGGREAANGRCRASQPPGCC